VPTFLEFMRSSRRGILECARLLVKPVPTSWTVAVYSKILAGHPDYITADGLHPGNKAHAYLAQLILSQIRHDHLWRAA